MFGIGAVEQVAQRPAEMGIHPPTSPMLGRVMDHVASLAKRSGRPTAASRSRANGRPLSHVELAFWTRPVAGEIEPGIVGIRSDLAVPQSRHGAVHACRQDVHLPHLRGIPVAHLDRGPVGRQP